MDVLKKGLPVRRLVSFAISLVLLLCSCSAVTSAQPEEKLVAVTATEATMMLLETEVAFSGRVMPENTTAVFSKLQGKVDYAPLSVGDTVEAGDVLFALETVDLALQLDSAAAAVDVAEAAYSAQSIQQDGSVSLAASQLEIAKKAMEDLTALYETGAATQTQLDEAQLQLEGAQLQYNTAVAADTDSVAAAQLEQAKTAYNAAATQMGYATVRAPVSGTVTYYTPKAHSMIGNAQPAVVISTQGGSKVTFSVSPTYAKSFTVGDEVLIDGEEPAAVTTVGELPDSSTGLICVEAVTGGTTARTAGEVVSVYAVTQVVPQAVALPLNAVRTDSGGDYIYVSDEEIAKKVYIESGINTGEYIEAVCGVTAGDIIVTSWSSLLEDGAKLKIIE